MAQAKIEHSFQDQSNPTMEYDETLMYGRYTKDLGEFAKKHAAKLKLDQKKDFTHGFKAYSEGKCQSCKRGCIWFRDTVLSKIGEDWIFLTLLGVTMALLSFAMDFAIEKCQQAHYWLYEELEFSPALQFFSWVAFPLVFICFSTGFVHIVGPNAIGSGIPEMKTVLRGVILSEYLTFRTLVAKMVGLCTSLGSGLPIGKEGPFVHVASITATLLGKLITSFRGIYETDTPNSGKPTRSPIWNESRNSEMLAAACAVGVACTFAAPIGGVLFSIEVTATYFAVRNYWRGFYSAVCGAFVFRLLAIFFKDEETITALFKTSLRQDFPFDPVELLVFSVIGIVCGFAGALFVFTHRKLVEFIRTQRKMTAFLQKNRFLFPSFVTLLISSLTFPLGMGQFMAGQLTNGEAVNELFSNYTWANGEGENVEDEAVLRHWSGPNNNLYVTLVLFIVMRFWMSALAITVPVPSGVFMPVFTIGAAFGRLMGESMAAWFPDGISGKHIVPGGYAIVGAAALSGSVTHTVSTSVIVFELTGQFGHILPAVIAVLISNAVAHCLQVSIYDSMIHIKRLPYLPDIINAQAVNAHHIFVEDFMVKDVKYLTLQSTYQDIYDLLAKNKFRSLPLVDSKDSRILLGSIQRVELESLVRKQLGIDPASMGSEMVDGKHTPQVQIAINEDTLEAEAEQPSTPSETTVGNKFSISKVESPSTPTTPAPTLPEDEIVPSPKPLRSILKKSDRPESQELVDMPFTAVLPNQEVEWEHMRLSQRVNFDQGQVDPAPFQLVERTSLYKVHSIFSLLSLHHAYVTNMGRLVGMVALSEVRQAIQGQVSKAASQKEAAKKRRESSAVRSDRGSQAVGFVGSSEA